VVLNSWTFPLKVSFPPPIKHSKVGLVLGPGKSRFSLLGKGSVGQRRAASLRACDRCRFYCLRGGPDLRFARH
jgi:hypothetical protein